VHAERRAIAAFGRPGPCNLCSGARALLIARKNSKALAKSPACLKGKSSSANLSMCHVEDGKVQAWPRGYRAQSCSRSGIPWARARGQERGRARKSSTCLEARSLQALHPQKDVDFSLRWSVVTQWKGGGAIFIAFFSDPSLKRRTMVEESPCPARPHCLIHLPPPHFDDMAGLPAGMPTSPLHFAARRGDLDGARALLASASTDGSSDEVINARRDTRGKVRL
jgi:hypothetical protein